jgi:hypothetical protein
VEIVSVDHGYGAINIVKDLRGVQACETSTND